MRETQFTILWIQCGKETLKDVNPTLQRHLWIGTWCQRILNDPLLTAETFTRKAVSFSFD